MPRNVLTSDFANGLVISVAVTYDVTQKKHLW
jgi:hypothetical protein